MTYNLINIMQNQEIKQKIEQISQRIKTYKAPQLQSYLQLSTQKATQIIGNNEIQTIRHSSLLKLLIYELIVFLDQKLAYTSSQEKTIRKGRNSVKMGEKCTRSLSKLNEIKQIVGNMSGSRSTQTELLIQISKFKLLLQKVRSLERQLMREDQQKKKQQKDSSDSQGTQIMIQQLEEIIKRKQNRIKQLNMQLQQNFNDKQELEEEIYLLELNNTEFAEKINELQQKVSELKKKNLQLQKKYTSLLQDFDKYKHKEKDQLLFGVSSFMNNQLPTKHMQPQPTILHVDHLADYHEPITNSTRVLFKYCLPSITINNQVEEKTIKKGIKMIESESQEQDLLLSVKQVKQVPLENQDHSLERLVLMQALFIQKALQSMVS